MSANSKIEWTNASWTRRVYLRFWETRRALRNLWAKIGWPLACWLDKRHPDWCWAHLGIDLGLGWDLWNWRWKAKDIACCRSDCERNGACWCGKLVSSKFTGYPPAAG